MKLEIFLAIAGMILNVTACALGIRYTLKYRNKLGLTYIPGECTPLFKSIIQTIDDIEILYEKQPISSSLMMLKGSFINDGNMDIDYSIVRKPLRMVLPSPFIWLKVKMVDSSEDIKTEHNIIDKRTLEFKWDLLKKTEFFRFDALILAEAKGAEGTVNHFEEKLQWSIDFTHRITNLDVVKKLYFPVTFRRPNEIKGLQIISLLLIFTSFGAFVWWQLTPDKEIHYTIEEKNGVKKEVAVTVIGKVDIEDIKNNKITRLKFDDFISNYRNLTPIEIRNKNAYLPLLFVAGWLGIPGIILELVILYMDQKRKRLAKLIYSYDAASFRCREN